MTWSWLQCLYSEPSALYGFYAQIWYQLLWNLTKRGLNSSWTSSVNMTEACVSVSFTFACGNLKLLFLWTDCIVPFSRWPFVFPLGFCSLLLRLCGEGCCLTFIAFSGRTSLIYTEAPAFLSFWCLPISHYVPNVFLSGCTSFCVFASVASYLSVGVLLHGEWHISFKQH